jgi:hypothetical protein
MVTGWKSFEPWLGRLEALTAEVLWRIAEEVPPEWYGGNPATIEALMETLLKRKSQVRELVMAFRQSDREPFPNWGRAEDTVLLRQFEIADGASQFVM